MSCDSKHLKLEPGSVRRLLRATKELSCLVCDLFSFSSRIFVFVSFPFPRKRERESEREREKEFGNEGEIRRVRLLPPEIILHSFFFLD